MKNLTFFTVLAVLAIVVSITRPASGYVVTVQVEGVVTGIRTYDGLELDDSVSVGSVMTGSCTYDSEAPDQYPGSSSTGLYSLISISISVSSYTFIHDPEAAEEPYFYISAGYNGFYYDIRSNAPLFSGPCWINGQPATLEDLDVTMSFISMYFIASTDTPMSDDLPDADSFPDLSVFNEGKAMGAQNGMGPSLYIAAEITSITVIPEPASVLLLGLGGLALLRKRRA